MGQDVVPSDVAHAICSGHPLLAPNGKASESWAASTLVPVWGTLVRWLGSIIIWFQH